MDDKKQDNKEPPLVSQRYIQSELTSKGETFFDTLKQSLPNSDWALHLERTKRSKTIISNAKNVELILTNGELKETFAFDEFQLRNIVLKDLPWRKISEDRLYDNWSDADERRMMHYLNKFYNIKGGDLVRNAYTEVSMSNKMHPIKKFITSAKWDGEKRIESVIIDFLGAEDTEYIRAVSSIFFTAAVTRIFKPGEKFDYMLVLVGEQGIRKSSFIEKIAVDWYSAGPPDFKSKEAAEILQNAWIIEIPELSAMRKNDAEQTKAFISKTLDEYRPAYARTAQIFPRKCVFVGTTNTYDFLQDSTGNRRFWPIDLDKSKVKYDFSRLDAYYIRQLWAEAYMHYLNGKQLALPEYLEAEARKEQEKHFLTDSTQGLIEEFLNMPLPIDWPQLIPEARHQYFKTYLSEIDEKENHTGENVGNLLREKVSPIEIWVECLGKKDSHINNQESIKIGSTLKILGWKAGLQKRARFKYYGQQKVYFKYL